jgi:O-antigen ligase
MTGIGPDRFSVITDIAFQQGRLTEPYRAVDPHSTLMGRLAETGLVGGITLVVLWIVIAQYCRSLLARDRSWIAVSTTAALLGLLVASVNADVMNFRFGWVVLGLLRGHREFH